MTPHPLSQLEAFPAAAHAFSQVLIWAQQQAPLRASLSGFESSANEHLRELGRLLVQGFFDACFEAELAAKQGKRRVSGRLIECVFGEVVERRLSEATDEGPARFPLDAQLNVPPERYSLGVRQRVAHAATSQPLGAVVLALKADGMQVPKRQAQQLAERAALDVEAFYALPEHQGASNDTDQADLLLVGSHDATGVLVRKEALRPDTKKKAELAGKKPKGDPTATAGVQRHSHRMACVSAVWDQAPVVRSVGDVLTNEKTAHAKLPRPQNKQVSASLEHSTKASVMHLLNHMQQRDPSGQRPKAMLVDGETKQLGALKTEGKKLGMTMQIVLDLLHVLHYVYVAGKAMYPKTPGNVKAWVDGVARRLLTDPPALVLAYLQREVASRQLTPSAKRALKKCLKYLLERQDHIHYADYLARGLPIASGVIEGTCRSLVKDRLGVTGARWGLAGAEAILKLRAVERNGDWEAYWAFHEAQEWRRHHAAKTAA
jgi:hypothetical protein